MARPPSFQSQSEVIPVKRLFTIIGVPLVLFACGGGEDRTIIQNTGSDTLLTVAQGWAEAYAMVDPSIAVAVGGGGSGTGISSLIHGTVDLANASREMKKSEIEAAKAAGDCTHLDALTSLEISKFVFFSWFSLSASKLEDTTTHGLGRRGGVRVGQASS